VNLNFRTPSTTSGPSIDAVVISELTGQAVAAEMGMTGLHLPDLARGGSFTGSGKREGRIVR